MTYFDKQRLYELLREIPKGRVITYGALAEALGNRAWTRVVGNALHHNPDGVENPCYKVVNSKGELSRAYAFGGIYEQKRRLEADGIEVENFKVDLRAYGIFLDPHACNKMPIDVNGPMYFGKSCADEIYREKSQK